MGFENREGMVLCVKNLCIGARMRKLLAWVVMLGCVMRGCCGMRDVIRTGAVLARSGPLKEMVDARKGYELGVDVINRLNGGQGFGVKDMTGATSYFKFGFESLDDGSDAKKHTEQLETLLRGDEPVDVLFGSHPLFAFDETRLANGFERINVQCCVGPDAVYEQGFSYVFGIPVSNKKYPESAIQSMVLRKMKRIAVLTRSDNTFTQTTCDSALAFAHRVEDVDHDSIRVKVQHEYEGDIVRVRGWHKKFVEDCIAADVEAVIACTLLDDGKSLVDAFHAAKKSMKAFFMTVGPSNAKWVEEMGDKADFLLSAGQWHIDLAYSDELFGTNVDYSRKYQALHGDRFTPSYVAASASAAVYTMMVGIQEAFVACDISQAGGDVDQLLFNVSALSCTDNQQTIGYERVRVALENVDIDTFFGKIKFNVFRRNVGNDPATTQVLSHKGHGRDIHAVLPIRAAKARLVMPAENKFKPVCRPGFFLGTDEFDLCQPCEPGKFSETKNAPHCDHCPAGFWTSMQAQKECTPCPEGTTTDGPGATGPNQCYCRDGFYNSQQESGAQCFECPMGAFCAGSLSLPIPLRGYWMNETWRAAAYECDSESVCVGGPRLACKTGFSGRMCAECSDGYYGVISNCYECPSKAAVVGLIVLVVLGWYVINVVVSKNVASLDMILSWAQLANVIGDVDLRWPRQLQLMFGVANVLDFDVDILEPSCLTDWSFRHNHLVQLSLPFLMSLLACLGYLSSWLVHKFKRYVSATTMDRLDRWLGWLVTVPHSEEELCAKWDATIAAFLSSIEVTYITVAKYCFDVFKCETIAGVSVLRSTPSIECGTQEHHVLKVLGIVGTIGYSFGYIVFVSWKIWQLHTHRTFQEAQNLRRYGFLYCRFELDYCWTAIVVLGRRLLFVTVLVFVNNPGFQAGALAIIINASLMLHVYTAPYVDTYLDVMFSFLLVALMFEAFSGVLFYSTNLPSSNRVILEWIVLLILYLLVAISIYFLMAELKRKYQNHRIRQLHCKDLIRRNRVRSICSVPIFSMVSSEGRDAMKMVTDELLETFDSSFLYSALKKHPEHIEKWDKLNHMLKDFMSDQSECSYLSREPVAKFWRKLVDRFPELVDFLAVADKEKREHFSAFATTLYQDFYLTNKIRRLPIFSILNWRDRAPMAQWLAMADETDRKFFTSFMLDLFKSAGRGDISSFDKKIPELLASYSTDDDDPSTGMMARTWNTVWSGKRSVSKELVLAELQSGRSPLESKRRPTFRRAARHVQTAVSLRMAATNRTIQQIQEGDCEAH